MNDIDENDFSEDFDSFWLEICTMAAELGVSPSYIEDEFLIDGFLVKVKEADPR